MRHKAVLKRLESVAEVRAALHVHRDGITDMLNARRPESVAEAGFSYQGYFDHVDTELLTVHDALVTSEDVHVRRLAWLAKLRRQSRDLTTALYRKQSGTRRIIAGLYGEDLDFELAAITGRTPREPRVLAEQVDQTIKLLRKPAGTLPAPRVGIEVDLAILASDLETDLKGFLKVRRRLARARKAVDGSRVQVHKRMTELDRVFLWIVQSLEGLFKLVGEDNLADRIRTSARRITRRKGEEEEEDGEEGEHEEDGESDSREASAGGEPALVTEPETGSDPESDPAEAPLEKAASPESTASSS